MDSKVKPSLAEILLLCLAVCLANVCMEWQPIGGIFINKGSKVVKSLAP